MKVRLRTILPIIFIGLSVLPLLIASFIIFWQLTRAETEQAYRYQDECALNVAIQLRSKIQSYENSLLTAAHFFYEYKSGQSDMSSIPAELHPEYFKQLMVVDFDGKVLLDLSGGVVSNDQFRDISVDEVKSLQQVKSTGNIIIGQVLFQTDTPYITLFSPVVEPATGKMMAAVVGDVDLEEIIQLVDESVTNKDLTLYIVDDVNRVIAHPDQSVIQTQIGPDHLENRGVAMSLSDYEVLYSSHRVEFGSRSFRIFSERSKQAALTFVQRIRTIILFTLIGSLFFACLMIYFSIRRVVRPITELTSAVDRMQAGDLGQRLDVNTDDELGCLTVAFNELSSGFARELGAHREAEDALREKEIVLNEAQQLSLTGSWELDIKTDIIRLSPAMQSILGLERSELTMGEFYGLVHFEDRQKVEVTINDSVDGNSISLEFRVVRPNGQERYFFTPGARLRTKDDGTPLRLIGVTRDITESVQADAEKVDLELQLRQSQKLEAIGTLAGGIAHDFNNILTAIMGYAQLAQLQIPEGDKIREDIDEVVTASQRAQELVKNILTFSRKADRKSDVIQIVPVIQEAVKLMRASLPSTIEIGQDIASECKLIKGESTQIHQVLMNLFTNALHAVEEKGGVIEVSLHDVFLSESDLSGISDRSSGDYVCLRVYDNGNGIPSEVKERLFEPFFTTKEREKGTGMGLSVVHGIVQDHHGFITIDTEVGSGTAFNVFLPAVHGTATIAPSEEVGVSGGTERILVVDDEVILARFIEHTLTRFGYTVTSCNDSEEALRKFTEDPYGFDLIITDQTMPKMTGDELTERAMNIRPEIPIVLCTGYSKKIDEESANELGVGSFIMKPLRRDFLLREVRRLLDDSAESVAIH